MSDWIIVNCLAFQPGNLLRVRKPCDRCHVWADRAAQTASWSVPLQCSDLQEGQRSGPNREAVPEDSERYEPNPAAEEGTGR